MICWLFAVKKERHICMLICTQCFPLLCVQSISKIDSGTTIESGICKTHLSPSPIFVLAPSLVFPLLLVSRLLFLSPISYLISVFAFCCSKSHSFSSKCSSAHSGRTGLPFYQAVCEATEFKPLICHSSGVLTSYAEKYFTVQSYPCLFANKLCSVDYSCVRVHRTATLVTFFSS